jgi:protein-tyrosine phosphatase
LICLGSFPGYQLRESYFDQVLFDPVCLHGQYLPQSICARGVPAQSESKGLEHTITVDSAGTHNYHPNSPPDERSQEHAAKRGYDLSSLRARQINAVDFDRHDLILVMDWDNLALVEDICPPEHRHKVRRLTEFCLTMNSPVVPDPYYGGAVGFDHVLDLVEDACDGLLHHLTQSTSHKTLN